VRVCTPGVDVPEASFAHISEHCHFLDKDLLQPGHVDGSPGVDGGVSVFQVRVIGIIRCELAAFALLEEVGFLADVGDEAGVDIAPQRNRVLTFVKGQAGRVA
jgi:hypothetical protein